MDETQSASGGDSIMLADWFLVHKDDIDGDGVSLVYADYL